MLERIDRAWLRLHGGTQLVSHMNMGHEHLTTCSVVDRRDNRPIGLSISKTSYKRVKRNGDKAGTVERTYYVTTHPDPIPTLDEALEILAIIRSDQELTHA